MTGRPPVASTASPRPQAAITRSRNSPPMRGTLPEPDDARPAGAGGAVPEVVISCHRPPAAFRPLPLACPGAVSPTKVYSGCPSKVAWAEPSERVIVPNVPVTPDAVAGPCTGGQFCAHVPLHLDVADVSGANQESVNPVLL